MEQLTLTQSLIEEDSFDDEIGKNIVKLEDSSETCLQIILQASFTYLIAGFGNVAARMVLDAFHALYCFFYSHC
ncbi:hypothetical protein DPMN_004246 [Dreissena polymorpha]|uniref:Uncharacterized protein n=1 Tax=Dreissena polymorpha TaxID=45954 RepID=A0A9D4RVI3_DREPO|nr:hypothetical protein DPMN_004246 [Dreissena polymorpha]